LKKISKSVRNKLTKKFKLVWEFFQTSLVLPLPRAYARGSRIQTSLQTSLEIYLLRARTRVVLESQTSLGGEKTKLALFFMANMNR